MSDNSYFDESTSILAPVLIVVMLLIIFGIFFFG